MWYNPDIDRQCTKKLCEDFKQLFLEKDNADVEIICGERTFDCHQLILSARSPVFNAMFKTDMVEKKLQKVEIKELSPEVVAQMLSFIYTGSISEIENTPEFLFELLSAADQYQLELLKKLSEEKLSSSLTVENCVRILGLAETYQASENLKKVAMERVIRNMHGLITSNSEDWSNMIKNQPDLAIEVMKQWANVHTCVFNFQGPKFAPNRQVLVPNPQSKIQGAMADLLGKSRLP